MYYRFLGDTKEKVVLFLHGWGADSNSFCGVVSCLPKNNVSYLLVDFLGFGKSEEPAVPYNVYDYASEVVKLLKSLEIKEVIVVGHSFGGRVGIMMASKFNGVVKKLILVDSAGVIEGRGLVYKLKVFWYKLRVKQRGSSKGLNLGSSDYKALKTDVMRKTFKRVVNEDLLPVAKEIRLPTELIWGELDKETTLKAGKKLNKAIKGSRLVVIEDAGHFCFLDKPKEFVYILYESIFL